MYTKKIMSQILKYVLPSLLENTKIDEHLNNCSCMKIASVISSKIEIKIHQELLLVKK